MVCLSFSFKPVFSLPYLLALDPIFPAETLTWCCPATSLLWSYSEKQTCLKYNLCSLPALWPSSGCRTKCFFPSVLLFLTKSNALTLCVTEHSYCSSICCSAKHSHFLLLEPDPTSSLKPCSPELIPHLINRPLVSCPTRCKTVAVTPVLETLLFIHLISGTTEWALFCKHYNTSGKCCCLSAPVSLSGV